MLTNRQRSLSSELENSLFYDLKPYLTPDLEITLPNAIWALIIIYSLPRKKLTCGVSGTLLTQPSYLQDDRIDKVIYNEISIRQAVSRGELKNYGITDDNVDQLIIRLPFNMSDLLNRVSPNLSTELDQFKYQIRNPRYWQHLEEEKDVPTTQAKSQNLLTFLKDPSNNHLNLAIELKQYGGDLLNTLNEPDTDPLCFKNRTHIALTWEKKETLATTIVFEMFKVLVMYDMCTRFGKYEKFDSNILLNHLDGPPTPSSQYVRFLSPDLQFVSIRKDLLVIAALGYLGTRIANIYHSLAYLDYRNNLSELSHLHLRRPSRMRLFYTRFERFADIANKLYKIPSLNVQPPTFSTLTNIACTRTCTNMILRISEGTLSLPKIRSHTIKKLLLACMLVSSSIDFYSESRLMRLFNSQSILGGMPYGIINGFFPLIRMTASLPMNYLAAHTMVREIEQKKLLYNPSRFFQPNTNKNGNTESRIFSALRGGTRILATFFMSAFVYLSMSQNEDFSPMLILLTTVTAGIRMFALGSLYDVREIAREETNLYRLVPSAQTMDADDLGIGRRRIL